MKEWSCHRLNGLLCALASCLTGLIMETEIIIKLFQFRNLI